MGRRPSTTGGRPHAVCTKLSDAEVADLDDRRGMLTRAEFMRWLLVQAGKHDLRLPNTP